MHQMSFQSTLVAKVDIALTQLQSRKTQKSWKWAGKKQILTNFSKFPFSPLQRSKTPETPNLSKICPSDCFGGFQSGRLKFGKICQNLSENYRFSNFDKFFQISVPLTGTPQNNRWDKFWTNLGVRAFLKAVRGKRARKSRFAESCLGGGGSFPFFQLTKWP